MTLHCPAGCFFGDKIWEVRGGGQQAAPCPGRRAPVTHLAEECNFITQKPSPEPQPPPAELLLIYGAQSLLCCSATAGHTPAEGKPSANHSAHGPLSADACMCWPPRHGHGDCPKPLFNCVLLQTAAARCGPSPCPPRPRPTPPPAPAPSPPSRRRCGTSPRTAPRTRARRSSCSGAAAARPCRAAAA